MSKTHLLSLCLLITFLSVTPIVGARSLKKHCGPSALKLVSNSIEPTLIEPGENHSTISLVFKARPLGGFPKNKCIQKRYFIDYKVFLLPVEGGPATRALTGQVEVLEPEKGDCKINVYKHCKKNGKVIKKLIKCFFKKVLSKSLALLTQQTPLSWLMA